ncbi:serine/threonine-protein kinase [Mycolicibacillus trivialis]|uniref:non-specific serine/threonine protein kinase n=1 Tax=Mycolicibacillus trivialis TaxID=1798 RepID=A0A1X2EJW9_9MYCO|nr:serine/threonine-protein kinase [Mycolicibacillus trivialis]ORX04658.1 hypothetical protein AWC30_09670 [Mycolicibacillus trivialis]
MDAAAQPRAGTRFGKYQLNRLLGRGGMGEVYEALDTEKDRTVALKILLETYSADQSYRRRFTREAHAAAQLGEPHVIPIHDWGEIDGCLYIDMRLVAGTNLRELLENEPMDPVRAVNICAQISGALDAAHARGVVHRDIKPENVIVADGDFAYLLDFGIAEQAGDTRLTKTGMAVGSMAYIAPERLTGEPTTAAVDIYGLACVLFECLTGRAPFIAATMATLMTEHLYTPPPSAHAINPRIPVAFDEVIARGMAKEPDDRYGSAGALARAAERALTPPQQRAVASAYPTAPAPPPAAYPTAPWSPPAPAPAPAPSGPGRRWVVPVVIATAALLLAVTGIGIGLWVSSERHKPATTTSATPLQTATTSAEAPTTSLPVPPPGIRGPDALGVNCDAGYVHPPGNVFGSRAVRGSAATSCFFTSNVLDAYWAAGQPDRAPRDLAVRGSRPCGEAGDKNCRGENFVMHCTAGDDWITCEGGNDARVYLY